MADNYSGRFGDGFRREVEAAFLEVLNSPPETDELSKARFSGVGGLSAWVRDELYPELREAFDCANPGQVEAACARGGLALLMLSDANTAMAKVFSDAYAGPESEREASLKAGLKAHNWKPLTGAQMIAAEREAQIEQNGWVAKHDDDHIRAELIDAALAYLRETRYVTRQVAAEQPLGERPAPVEWPWALKYWKPASRIKMLRKAGALIAAEIDRLLRAGEKP